MKNLLGNLGLKNDMVVNPLTFVFAFRSPVRLLDKPTSQKVA